MSQQQQFHLPTINYNDSFDVVKNIAGLTLALDYRWGVYTDTAMTALAGVGQTVKGWRNRATDAYHATEATNPPLLAADGLQFDGVNDVLRVTRMMGEFNKEPEPGFSYFVVASVADGRPSAIKAPFSAVATVPLRDYFNVQIETSGNIVLVTYENDVAKSVIVNNLADGQSAVFLVSAVANPAVNLTGYFNGTQAGTPTSLASYTWSNIATAITEAPFIGARSTNGAPGAFTACTIRALLIYNRPLSPTELLTIHRYLGHAHGISVP